MRYWLETPTISAPPIELVEIERLRYREMPISASRVRQLLAKTISRLSRRWSLQSRCIICRTCLSTPARRGSSSKTPHEKQVKMKINQPAVAGTLESGDVMIRIAPLDTQDIDLQINSSVEKQFGDAIRTTILDVLARYNVRGVQLNVDDKGALDCILRARLEALLARASGIPALPWEDCQ